jgi:hypothetical protein
MPATSKRQFRFMKAVEGGYIHPKGLSPKKAKEYTSENKSLSKLPESADSKKRFSRTMKKLARG